MNQSLKEMCDKNIFTKIAVVAVEQRTQNEEGMKELIALYLAMGWISANESAEVLGYAQQKLVEVA